MNREEMDDLTRKFYEGKSSPEEEEKLFSSTFNDEVERNVMKTHETYFKEFKTVTPNENSMQAISFFDSYLKPTGWSVNELMKVAAMLLIGMVLYFSGYFSYQVINKTEERISSLEDQLIESQITLIKETFSQKSSHSKRKGIALVSKMGYMDERIANELLTLLGSSDNINLRLMSLDLLSRHVSSVTIKNRVFATISSQDSELVLAELARIAIVLKDKEAAQRILEQMEELSKDSSHSFPLKDELKILI